MFFPLRTDRAQRRTPWANYGLIGANVLIFLLFGPPSAPGPNPGVLYPTALEWHQLFTYQFLHGGIWHIAGNMLFLYVFGNGVEDRIGPFPYLAFYLAGGAAAGLGHAVVESSPVIGASGSVAAVTGAFLALMPMTQITVLYFFFFIGAIEVPAIYAILLQIGINVFYLGTGTGGNVAYLAHLAGYGFGLAVGLGLLATRLLSREPYDLLTLLGHRHRRARFQRLARSGARPWEAQRTERVARDREAERPDPEVADLRERIQRAWRAHDYPRAAQLYAELLERDPEAVLGEQQQLDVANQLMSEGRYESAGRAYELFLRRYQQTHPQREQVQLMLGLVYGRYLGSNPERARELLQSALERLRDPRQRALAEDALARIPGAG